MNAVLVRLGVLEQPLVWFIHPVTAWVPDHSGRRLEDDAVRGAPAPRRAAEHRPVALRGGPDRRGLGLAPVPPRDPAAAAAGDPGGAHLPDAGRLPRLRPGLRAHRRGPGNFHRADRALHLQRPVSDPALRLRLGAVGDRVPRHLRPGADLHPPAGCGAHGSETMSASRWAPVAVLTLLVAASAFPFYWAVVSSFTPEARLFQSPSLIPRAARAGSLPRPLHRAELLGADPQLAHRRRRDDPLLRRRSADSAPTRSPASTSGARGCSSASSSPSGCSPRSRWCRRSTCCCGRCG